MARQKGKGWNLYIELREAILSGRKPGGSQLPGELDMAAQRGLSRQTIRYAFKLLSDEGLIERYRTRGTFVSKKLEPQTVSLLLPSLNEDLIEPYSKLYHHQIMSGVIAACHRRNCRFTVIFMSPDNRFENISWHNFDHLDEDGLLIVPSRWFHPLYEFLAERRCRVILFAEEKENAQPYPDFWRCYELHVYQVTYEAVARMWHRQCRNIALISPYLKEINSPLLNGYLTACKEYDIIPNFIALDYCEKSLTEIVQKMYSNRPFDGLVLCPRNRFMDLPAYPLQNKHFSLPSTVQITITRFFNAATFETQTLPIIGFDYRKLGELAVDDLLQEHFQPTTIRFEPSYYHT